MTTCIRIGERFSRAVVIGVASQSKRDGRYWAMRCDCGGTFAVRDDTLAASSAMACRVCRPRSRITSVRACASCRSPSHNAQNCPPRTRREGRLCGSCMGMPHRRDADGCAGCGKPYAPEPPITLADVEQMPREDRRSV